MKVNSKTTTAGLILATLLLLFSALINPAFAAGNVPVEIEIPITYIVDGNEDTAGGDKFTLIPDDPGAPMPDGAFGGEKSIEIREEGSYSFGTIRYEKPEVYWYTVIRDITEKKGVTKDDSVFRVKVIALNDGHGYVLAYLEGSDKKKELVYMDRVAPDTGDHNILLIYSGVAFTSAAALALIAAVVLKNRKKETGNEL